ncbi:MAG TPA: TerC family protein [Steroidobacteraceae bacterium]
MLALLSDPQTWLAFITLTLLEIVLGFDNIIFISILVGRLPPARRETARITGLALAMVTRIALLFSIVWLTSLVEPLFHVAGEDISGRDLILFAGGLFLLAKSVLEIHHTLDGAGRQTARANRVYASFTMIVVQIGAIDVVFSLDSVFTAVGLAKEISIMVAAIVASMLVMMWVSSRVGAFIERYPTIKMLALAFLILIGVALVGESLEFEIPKGYLYFAMAFAVIVELINIRLRRKLDDGKALDQNEGEGG